MITTTSPSKLVDRPVVAREAPAPPSDGFGKEVPGYNGPKDGLSHPKHRWLIRPLNRALIALCYRIEVEGKERFPREGGQVFCPTHQSVLDPLIIGALTNRDMRYVAKIEAFRGILGKILTWGGAFPVDRKKPDPRTLQHGIDLVRQGIALCMFPEGGIPEHEKQGQVGPLKTGAARAALAGEAESVVPIAVHLRDNDKPRYGELAVGALLGLMVAAGGMAAAVAGGPAACGVAAGLGGTLTGIQLFGRLARTHTPKRDWSNPLPRMLATFGAGAAGGVVAGLAAGLGAWLLPGLAPHVTAASAAVGAVGTYRLALAWRNRRVANILIPEPLAVKNSRGRGDERADVIALTEDLHRALGKAKEQLTGVLYDENAPKIRHGKDQQQGEE